MRRHLTAIAAAAILTAAAATALCGCKGRTADNVEPTGETVEVVINSDTFATDTVATTPVSNEETQ